ncbi:MAG TPA: Mth938-like domain-containing protein [Gammaproteobacteria bacterium]|nr:Mth938-like domain-containing protein [Gammaproteobacteria bacterium]
MRFAQDTVTGTNVIRAYADGELTINQEVVRTSVVVTPDRLMREWPPESFEELEEGHVAALAELGAEIVLIGTGRRQLFPPPRFTAALMAQGIGVEVMDTAAACRTYNILLSEDRNVAAALFMI